MERARNEQLIDLQTTNISLIHVSTEYYYELLNPRLGRPRGDSKPCRTVGLRRVFSGRVGLQTALQQKKTPRIQATTSRVQISDSCIASGGLISLLRAPSKGLQGFTGDPRPPGLRAWRSRCARGDPEPAAEAEVLSFHNLEGPIRVPLWN